MASSGSTSVKVTDWDTLKFSWSISSQSIANNTSTVSWKLELISGSDGRIDSTASKNWSVTVNGTSYSGTNKITIGNNATITLANGTTTIAHNSNGTKTFSYSFSQQFSITFSGASIGTKSGSGSGTLNTIARKSSLTASNGTLGTAQTLTVSRHDSTFTHTITYKCGDTSGTIATKSSSTSISWTPPLTLANQNTSGTSVSIVFTITTYTGSTSIGSNTKSITCAIPSSVKPTVSLTVTDSTGYASTYGSYIQGKSKASVSITASGSYGSTIKQYKTTADGKTYTTASFTTNVILSSGTVKISVTVTDSRGRTATASANISVIPYAAPKITALSVRRCDANGNANSSGAYLAVTFSSEITALNNKNSAVYSVQYKKSSASAYTTTTLTNYGGQYKVTNGVFVFAAETASTHDIIMDVSDAFDSSTKTTTGASIFKLWSILSKGLGFAIGKMAEMEGVFDIGFKTRFSGGVLPLVLPSGTDVNDLFTPNQYIGMEASEAEYMNLPFDSNTSFTLEVFCAGEVGQVMQRCTLCRKTTPVVYERFYYQSSWGEWVRVSDFGGKLLATPGMYMTSGHTVALSEAVSKQPHGIVLVFSEYYDGEVKNQTLSCHFVPKMIVANHNGVGHSFVMTTSNLAYFATKYLYIHDTTITGHANNSESFTNSGITCNNNRFVLRYVIGV